MNLVPRPCSDRELLLHGLADNELDPGNALTLEEHVRTCRECAAAFDDILLQKKLLKSEALHSHASPALKERILAALAAEEMPERAAASSSHFASACPEKII